MDEMVARCPDCGREHSEPFARCDWCGRGAPSRWWCVACLDWRPANFCPACAGGLGVPSEVFLGVGVSGTTVVFQFPARNTGTKHVTCGVAALDPGVALGAARITVPAGRTATVGGELLVPRGPAGRRTFRVAFDTPFPSETLLVVDVEPAAPRLEFVPAAVRLRAANPGTVVRSSVGLKNTGNVPLTANLSAARAWLGVEPKRLALAPGESTQVRLRARSKKTDCGALETTLTAAADGATAHAAVSCLLPDPELTADPVEFGELVSGRAAFAEVVVRNVGRVRVDSTVGAADPWLRVVPARVNLSPGREKTVRVRALLTAEHDGPQASELLVSSAGGVVLRIPVGATGKVPKPVLRAVRRQRFCAATGLAVERKFQVANDGDGPLVLTARSSAAWLEIVTPELRVAGGKKRKLRYVVDATALPLGERAATITLESNAGAVTVPVTVQVLDPNPLLEVVSGPDLGLLAADGPVSAFVQVRNAGVGMLRVRAESESPRNAVAPAELDVPPGPPVRINVTIPVAGLPGGDYEAGVRLTSNGGAGRAAVRFRLTAEQLDVPSLLALGVREAGRPRWDWLRVRNTSPYPVALRVSTGDQGIKLETDRVTVASLQTAAVAFYLDPPADFVGPVTGAIRLEGRAARYDVAVRAVVRTVELVADPDVVDLGDLVPGAERAFIASVVNVGEIAADLPAAHARGALEVWVRPATVPPGERVTLSGRAKLHATQPGQRVATTVPLGHGVALRCEANAVAPVLPRVLAAAAATGGLLAGGAVSVAVGWWAGVPLGLAGLLLGAWLLWREM